MGRISCVEEAPGGSGDILKRHCVQVFGAAGAPETVLFLNGIGADQRIWSRLVSPFSPYYRIVLMDHAGTRSADPSVLSGQTHRHWHLRAYAQDVLAVCRALDLIDVTLVGHGAGGIMGLLASNEEPWRFRRQVMINTSPRYVDDGQYRGGFSRNAMGDIRLLMLRAASGFEARSAISAERFDDPADRLQAFAASLEDIPQEFALHALVALMTGDYRDDLVLSDIPTLLLHARQDPLVGENVAEYLQRHLAGSQLQWLAPSGPCPPMGAAEEIRRALVGFGLRDGSGAPVSEFPGFPESVCWGAAPGSW